MRRRREKITWLYYIYIINKTGRAEQQKKRVRETYWDDNFFVLLFFTYTKLW